MIANFGYRDGSGEYYIAIDMARCDGCGRCAADCASHVLVVSPNPFDPLDERPVAVVSDAHARRVRESCAGCKPVHGALPLPCVTACPLGAIAHSW